MRFGIPVSFQVPFYLAFLLPHSPRRARTAWFSALLLGLACSPTAQTPKWQASSREPAPPVPAPPETTRQVPRGAAEGQSDVPLVSPLASPLHDEPSSPLASKKAEWGPEPKTIPLPPLSRHTLRITDGLELTVEAARPPTAKRVEGSSTYLVTAAIDDASSYQCALMPRAVSTQLPLARSLYDKGVELIYQRAKFERPVFDIVSDNPESGPRPRWRFSYQKPGEARQHLTASLFPLTREYEALCSSDAYVGSVDKLFSVVSTSAKLPTLLFQHWQRTGNDGEDGQGFFYDTLERTDTGYRREVAMIAVSLIDVLAFASEVRGYAELDPSGRMLRRESATNRFNVAETPREHRTRLSLARAEGGYKLSRSIDGTNEMHQVTGHLTSSLEDAAIVRALLAGKPLPQPSTYLAWEQGKPVIVPSKLVKLTAGKIQIDSDTTCTPAPEGYCTSESRAGVVYRTVRVQGELPTLAAVKAFSR
jgi:hypothetical protein